MTTETTTRPQRPPTGVLRERQPDGFERVQLFSPAYDFRGQPGNFGQHVAEFYFGLVGPAGAVSVRIFSGWAHGAFHEDGRPDYDYQQASAPCGAGLGIHQRPADGQIGAACSFLGTCASGEISFTASDPIWRALVQEGWEPMWAALREWYDRPSIWERS